MLASHPPGSENRATMASQLAVTSRASAGEAKAHAAPDFPDGLEKSTTGKSAPAATGPRPGNVGADGLGGASAVPDRAFVDVPAAEAVFPRNPPCKSSSPS